MSNEPEIAQRIARVERAIVLMTEAIEKIIPLVGEIHAACTATKPKSDLEPWMQKIADAGADTADGISRLVVEVGEVPGRTAALLESAGC